MLITFHLGPLYTEWPYKYKRWILYLSTHPNPEAGHSTILPPGRCLHPVISLTGPLHTLVQIQLAGREEPVSQTLVCICRPSSYPWVTGERSYLAFLTRMDKEDKSTRVVGLVGISLFTHHGSWSVMSAILAPWPIC